MTCPRCANELRQQRRDGIEIDVCAQCRGVWLDRGELERLTEAENRYYGDDDDDDDDTDFGDDDDDTDDGGGRGRGGRRGARGGRRRGGFFQNLLDNLGDIGG